MYHVQPLDASLALSPTPSQPSRYSKLDIVVKCVDRRVSVYVLMCCCGGGGGGAGGGRVVVVLLLWCVSQGSHGAPWGCRAERGSQTVVDYSSALGLSVGHLPPAPCCLHSSIISSSSKTRAQRMDGTPAVKQARAAPASAPAIHQLDPRRRPQEAVAR